MSAGKGATRREFIKQSAVMAGAPAVITSSSKTFGQVGKSDIQCAIIGTGNRGKSVLKAVVQVPGVHLAALCDINPKAVDQAMEIVGDHKPQVFTFHQDMLAASGLDAVLIETPPHLHREHTIEALQAGYHCSVAKPMALTVNELNDIKAAAGKAKGIVHVDQQLRYRPQYTQAMRMIHDGKIGEVGFVRAQRYGSWNGEVEIGDYQKRKAWLYRVEQSGDTIVENQIHNIDIINWIMNDHPVRASGLGGQNMIKWDGNELLDNYGLTFEYPGNRYAVFSKISYAVSELSGTFIHAYGSKAGADVSYDGAVKIIWRGKKTQPTVIDVADVDMNRLSMQDFFQCIRDGKQPFADVDVGRDAALTTLLGRKAIYEKRTVSWDDLLREGTDSVRRES